MNSLKNLSPIIAIICLVIVSLACGQSSTAAPIPSIDPNAIDTAIAGTIAAQPTANEPTNTPQPTFTFAPTFTSTITFTPVPTFTPMPTNTPTQPPQPIILTGSGDSIVDIQKWDGPALLHARHSGSSNFIVHNYSASSADPIGYLVNTIGNYEGTVPLDFYKNEHTARFEVKADGTWELQIQPLDTIRKIQLPATVEGNGDDVFAIQGTPDLIKADASQGTSNFIVHSFGDNGEDFVFNEISPYTGTAMLDPSTFIIVVSTEGHWLLEITTK